MNGPVLLAGPGPSPASGVLVATVAASPTPSPTPESFSPLEVSPGLAGFIPVFLIALACIVLFLSLTRHLRRVTVRQAELDAAERERERLDGPPDAAGTDDRDPGTR